MEVIGTIKMIGATQQVSASFKKRELVVTSSEQYPQHILIEFNQDKCDLLNNYQVGQSVKVDINLRGREWVNPQGEAKYFNQIQGWRISKITDDNPSAVDNYQAKAEPFKAEPMVEDENHDDLPFS